MRQTLLLPALAFAGLAASEDVLYSSRLQKRDIDASGNFNMCTSQAPRTSLTY